MRDKTGGIRIRQQERESGVIARGTGLLLLLLYFYMTVFGCVYGFLSIFLGEYPRRELAMVLLFFGALFYVAAILGRYRRGAIVLLLAAYGWFLWSSHSDLGDGAADMLEMIRQTASGYTRAAVTTAEGEGRELLSFLLAVLFPWSGILFTGMTLRGGRFFAAISVGLTLGAVFAVGQTPPFLGICLMILGLAGIFSADGMEHMQGQKLTGLFLLALTGLLLAAGWRFGEPAFGTLFEDKLALRHRIQNTDVVRKLRRSLNGEESSWASMGVGNGSLGDTEFSSVFNGKVMTVTLDHKPEETLYLRCFTGVAYTGHSWAVLQESVGAKEQEERLNASFFETEQEESGTPWNMQIDLEERAGDYDYRPYYAQEKGRSETRREYRYYPESQVRDRLLSGPGSFVADMEYLEFAARHYLMDQEIPPELLKNAGNFFPRDLEELISDIQDYLRQQASYDLHAERTPEGKDFVDYFLYESHEGYCVHFATATALLLRMYGLASRYVSGYAVPAEDFRLVNGKYVAEVKDSRAHAWAEVYLGEAWIIVEATPGYISSGETEEDTPHTSAPPQSEKEDPAKTEKKESPSGSFQVPGWVYAALAVAAVVFFALLALRRIYAGRRRSAGVRELYCDICGMFALAGFEPEEDCSGEEALGALCTRFPWIDPAEFAVLSELALRANFGQGPMSREETDFARQMYRKIEKGIREEISAERRFVLWLKYR